VPDGRRAHTAGADISSSALAPSALARSHSSRCLSGIRPEGSAWVEALRSRSACDTTPMGRSSSSTTGTAVTWFCANSLTISLNGMSRGARTTSGVMSSSTVRWCMSPLPSELLRGRSAGERSVRHSWFGLPGPCGGAVRVARWIHNILRKGRRPCELTSAIRSL
jgi:hypothetical protein